jgi:hypothetical protein
VRTRKGPAPVIAVLALTSCACLHACSADLLSFGAGSTPAAVSFCETQTLGWLGGLGGAWTPYAGTNDNLRIEDLPFGYAYQLCLWIDQGENPCTQPSVAQGYATGQAATCSSSATRSAGTLSMVWLGLDDCVANIQHTRCAALVADLTACVQYFGTHGGDADCSAAAVACAAYESAAGCDETVIQANPNLDTASSLAADCAVSLPIVPGVTCPPSEPGIPGDAGLAYDDGGVDDASDAQ